MTGHRRGPGSGSKNFPAPDAPASLHLPGDAGLNGVTVERSSAAPARRAAPPDPQPPGGAAIRSPDGGARMRTDAPPSGTSREWVISLPPGLELLSLNQREHWGKRNSTYQALKKAAWALILNTRVPRLDRISVTVVYDPPDRRRRDPDNLALTVKALVDAAVASKIIVDDDSSHVAWAHAEIGGQVYPKGRLRLVIREVAP